MCSSDLLASLIDGVALFQFLAIGTHIFLGTKDAELVALEVIQEMA